MIFRFSLTFILNFILISSVYASKSEEIFEDSVSSSRISPNIGHVSSRRLMTGQEMAEFAKGISDERLKTFFMH